MTVDRRFTLSLPEFAGQFADAVDPDFVDTILH
jgi:hypothetical protein